mgnify:CR=1 FL=1
MLDSILILALVVVGLSILGCLYRIIRGPTMTDRIMALDSIGVHLISSTAITSILLRTSAFFEVILLIGIISFVGTIAFTKYIERGRVIEYERD